MMTVLYIKVATNFVHQDRRPAFTLLEKINVHPAVQEILFERPKPVIEITVAIESSNNFANRDVFEPDRFSVWTLLEGSFRESRQFCVSSG
jgi:hypothetical protein